MNTRLTVQNRKFLINGSPVYSEIGGSNPAVHGMLMNARFIQGIFDDSTGRRRYARFGFDSFDPEKNTDSLIAALPEWYSYGLRAFTVGMQGGGPCFTINNYSIENSPYSEDGRSIDCAHQNRLDRLIRAADGLGMAVIVSLFYGAQSRFLKDDLAVMAAVKTVSNWLRDSGFTNVIIEIANEHDVSDFKVHPVLYTPEGICDLISIAKRESGGIPVGCSGTGGYFSDKIALASDVILIHGNGQSRQQYWNLMQKAFAVCPEKPVLCNEDSQALSNMAVSVRHGVSWGYYNNLTKQEPPTRWAVLPGEDTFFARRMAEALGIVLRPLPLEEQFFLHGFEKDLTFEGSRWIRLASLYPEKIERVEFYRDGTLFAAAYDDPFTINFRSNWLQGAVTGIAPGENWEARIFLAEGTQISKKTVAV